MQLTHFLPGEATYGEHCSLADNCCGEPHGEPHGDPVSQTHGHSTVVIITFVKKRNLVFV